MKKTFTRLTALLLLVALLSSFAVPATFAENGVIAYDFKLYENANYLAYYREQSNLAADAAVAGHNMYSGIHPYAWFENAFPETVNWAIESNDGQAPTNFAKDFYVDTAGGNLRVDMGKTSDGKVGAVSVRLNVPQPDTYKIDLSFLEVANPSAIAAGSVLNVYIFPAYKNYSPSTNNNTQVAQYLTPANLAGTITYQSAGTYTINSAYTFSAEGEYIMALQEATSSTCRYIYPGELTLTPANASQETTAPADTTAAAAAEQVFDFQLYKNAAFIEDCTTLTKDTATGYINRNFQAHRYYDGTSYSSGDHTVVSWFYDNYPETVNWGVETSAGQNAGPKDYYFRAASDQGVRLGGEIADGQYVSLRIRIAESGEYDVSLLAGSSGSKTDVYIFPAATEYSAGTLTSKAALETAMQDPANQLANDAVLTGNTETDLGSMTFAEGEYIVVFRSAGAWTNGICVRTLTLTPATAEPEETTEPEQTTTETTTEVTTQPATESTVPSAPFTQTYDFELYNNTGLAADSTVTYAEKFNIYSKKYNGSDAVYTWFYGSDGAYATGKINWRPEASNGKLDETNDSTSNEMKNFYFFGDRAGGMGPYLVTESGLAAGQFAAIRFKVAFPGEYAVKLTAGSTASKADVFIFPASTTSSSAGDRMTDLQDDAVNQITPYLIDSNKVGSVNLTANALVKVGNWNFSAAGDYIVVFQIPENGTKDIFLDNMILVPADEDAEIPTDPSETTPSVPAIPDSFVLSDTDFNMALYPDEAYQALFFDAESGTLKNTGYNKKCYDCGKNLRTCLNTMYKANQVNWVLEGFSENITADKMIFRAGSDQGLRVETDSGEWVAFRMKVGVTGKYNVNVESIMPYANSAKMYLFPAAADTMTTEQLTAAMTEENYLGLARTSSTVLSAPVAEYDFQTAGEYIVLMQLENATRLYLGRIYLEKPAEPEPKPVQDEVIYNFDLMAKDERLSGKFFTNNVHNEDGTKFQANVIVNQFYQDGVINWQYENSSPELYTTGVDFRTGCFRFKMVPDMREIPGGDWVAFRLDNPGTATYDIRAITTQKGNLLADVYMIPAPTALAMTVEEIEEAMTAENLVRSDFYFKNEGENYIGEYTFGNNDHYILVLHLKKGARAFLKEIEMTVDGKLSDPAIEQKKTYNGTVYDLDLADEFDGIYYAESKYFMPDVIDDMNARWANGSMNWKFLNASEGLASYIPKTKGQPETTLRFYRNGGFRVYSKKNSWVALKIKSPGSGDFTISLNHALDFNSCELAMYILPADTDPDKLWEATDPSNRVGKIKLFNENGSTEFEDGVHSYLGYWNFEAGKEYIIILEAYENSDFADNGYMNLSQIIMERGIIDFKTEEDAKKVKPVTVEENVLPVADAGMYGAVAEVYGHDYYYLPLEGGGMLVYDLDTGELIDKVEIGHSRPYYVCVDQDGRVYVTGKSKTVNIYDPYTQTLEKSPRITDTPGLEGIQDIFSMAIDENGTVWLGGYYGAYIASYDRITKEFTSFGQPYGYQNRIAGMICRDGYLYGTVHNTDMAKIFKMDTTTGQIVADVDVFHLMGTATYINSLNFLGDDYLIAGGNHLGGPIVLDPNTFEFVDLGLYGPLTYDVTEEIDGKHYFVQEGYGLYKYDIATKTVSKVPGFGTTGIGFRTASQNSFGKSLVTLDGDHLLFTYSTGANGSPRMFNLDTKEYESWDNLVVHGTGGAEIRGFTNGPEGSNQLYMGGWNTDNCAVYNTELGKIEYFYKTGGQTDVQRWYEGKLYAGNYSSTTLNEIYPNPEDTSLPATNELIQRWKLDHAETGQKRIHAMTGGDGYVFAGTIPDSDLLGGAVVVYDTRTGRWKYERNVVQDQSISGLAFSDNTLCGVSSIGGGSGAVANPWDSAVIFVYDYKEMKREAVLDPREYFDGMPDIVPYVASIEPDPVVEGRFWSIVSETLFCFTYDKENKTFDVQEVISFSKTYFDTSGNSALGHSFPILFDAEKNMLYATFGATAGFHCVELEDLSAPMESLKVVSHERLMDQKPTYYLMGEDGNVYFGSMLNDNNLAMLPLNVTDEDWAIAEAVDQMILDIGEEITVESEAAIRTARSSYENLSWRYKALIQKLEVLQEAESDILECKVDTWKDKEMTADDYPAMQELMDEYKGLNERQQRYVKNYSLLKEKYDAASDLNDQRIAAAMQKRIDALADKLPVTLDDEPEVVQIRADYKTLTGKQGLLVDITLLEEAEAQIKVLRAEFVKYTETLIQAIPDEITLSAEPAITAAREAADKLYANERKNVSYSKLTSAEGKLRTLQKAKAAAEEVDALIKAIGIVTLGDKDRIAEARAAYDALNGTALTFVQNGKKLERAEWILKALQTWGIPAIVAVVAGAGFCVTWFVPSLHKKVFKTKKKEEETEVIDN